MKAEMTNLQTQEEIRRIIISDMVKKRNSIVPVIGEDTIVYKAKGNNKEEIVRSPKRLYLWFCVE